MATGAATGGHRRRAAVLGAAAAVGGVWLVVLGVVAVAMGATAPPTEAGTVVSIPSVALDAYRRTAASPKGTDCGLRWQVLAGVAKVESDHAGGRSVEPDGTVAPPLVGPVLDGTGGTARIPDSDGGRLDGNVTWDAAVGPLQFLPSTWAAYGVDANGDGRADAHNLYDAAQGAAAHLCTGGGRLDDEENLRAALFAYNHSDDYVGAVMGWIAAYDQAPAGAEASPGTTGPLVQVRGIVVAADMAAGLDALLDAAATDGVALAGSGHRSREQQIALRRAHCGTSTYAVYEMASQSCSPPTARPGESMHESGLAVDFTCAGALVVKGDACFAWLTANAARYGLHNLPSEPWHWSSNGR